jgi:hypothetical protein
MIGKSGKYYRAGYLARQAGDWPDGTDSQAPVKPDSAPAQTAQSQTNTPVPAGPQAGTAATAADPSVNAPAHPATNAVQNPVGGGFLQAVQGLSQKVQNLYHQNIDPLEQRVDNWQRGNGFSTNTQVPLTPLAPPPPRLATPGVTGDAKHAFLVGLDDSKIGSTTVAGLAKTLHNESNGLTGGKPGELVKGKTAEANAIINNAGSRIPHQMASSAAGVPLPEDQDIMRGAYYDRLMGGSDPVQGRTYFGNSAENLSSRPIGNSRQTVYSQYGPYTWGKNAPQYIYLYNDPLKK